jgi:hypothetical protein
MRKDNQIKGVIDSALNQSIERSGDTRLRGGEQSSGGIRGRIIVRTWRATLRCRPKRAPRLLATRIIQLIFGAKPERSLPASQYSRRGDG